METCLKYILGLSILCIINAQESNVSSIKTTIKDFPAQCLRTYLPGFSEGSVVKNLAASARDTGSIPGPGRFHMRQSKQAHASQLLSMCSRAREWQLLRPQATTTEAHVL